MMIATGTTNNNNGNKRKQTVPKSKPAKTCDKCAFSTNEMVEFIEHMKLDHNLDEIYPCDMCVFYTESLWDYQGHMEKHVEQKHIKGQNSTMNSSASSSTTESTSTESIHNKEEIQGQLLDHMPETATVEANAVEATKAKSVEDEDEEEEPEDDEDEEIPHSDEDEYEAKDMSANLMTSNGFYTDKKNKLDNNSQNQNKANDMLYESSGHHHQALTGSSASSASFLFGQRNSANVFTDHNGVERVKRHYNSEVDPARYRKVLEEGVTKFACSLCGNTYKWRKSLNKHWKEKHITEIPPPLDAPVTVKLRNGNTTINCIAAGSDSKKHSTALNQVLANAINKPTDKKPTATIPKESAALQQPQQLPFSPSLLVAAAAAANAATAGQGQQGQLHPAYWTVFHQYLNSATSKSQTNEQPGKNSNKFTIDQLTGNTRSTTETPLDLSMKPVISSRRSSLHSSCSNDESHSSELQMEDAPGFEQHDDTEKLAKGRTSRRSDFNMQKNHSHSSSRDHSNNSSESDSYRQHQNESDMNSKNDDHYQSYTEDEAMLNMSQSNGKYNSPSANASQTAYNQKLFVCSICDEKFHVVDHINEHFSKNHYNEYQRELSSKSPPRNTNVAAQNEEWNLSDPNNPLKCIKCDFVGRWPTELQKHAASHSTSRPFKCLICSLTYKWRWDLAKHFDRTHPNFRNPYKKRDRDAARSTLVGGRGSSSANNSNSLDQEDEPYEHSRSRSRSNSSNGSEMRHQQNSTALTNGSNSIKRNDAILYQQQQQTPALPKPKNSVGRPPKVKTEQAAHQQMPLPMNPSFGTNSPNQSQFANNPMMAYFAALQSNMFQQTPSSSSSSQASSNQISPFSLLQKQQQQNNNPFMAQQMAFNQGQSQDNNNNTATILAAAMAAIAQGGMDSSNMSQLLPLLQNLQNSSATSSATSAKAPTTTNSFNSNLLSPSSSSSSHTSYHKNRNSEQQPNAKKQKLSDSLLKSAIVADEDNNQTGGEKEARNFLCYWCDFRGRWRSEIIQHMRCHHAREKPYRCSACMYASNWKWDVQKHTKKQHPSNPNAKIIEISDQILFPDLKDMNFFENVKPVASTPNTDNHRKQADQLNLTPPNSTSVSSASSSSSSSSLKSKPLPQQQQQQQQQRQNHGNKNRVNGQIENKAITKNSKSLCCQQCPYVACNLSDLRRHLIVHSNEQPYHCCSCDFKSKWKSDVKKHQRSFNHTGPILVGKKAMQKVIENLGLDRNSMVTLYGPNIQVIDNKQCKSNEKLIDEDNLKFSDNTNEATFQKNKSNKLASKVAVKVDGGLKRKQPDSDNEEYEEFGQYDEEEYDQLNEDYEDLDDEYAQVLAYNGNNGNGEFVDDMEDGDQEIMNQESGLMEEEDEGLNEEYVEEFNNSQYSDLENNEELIENNFNEFEEEIDC